MDAIVLDKCVPESLAPELGPNAEQPRLFDGTTRLYMSYTCPYAQRVWITRNYKGLQDQIKLVPITLGAKPAWYAGKVYSVGKVPSLEHNRKIMGESLNLIKYLDSKFQGPSLTPKDPAKKRSVDVLLTYVDEFARTIGGLMDDDVSAKADPAFGKLEKALGEFNDGPFFVGEFSLVDIAYAPLIERFQHLLEGVQYDVTAGRPQLAAWIEAMNKVQAYKQTKGDPNKFHKGFMSHQ